MTRPGKPGMLWVRASPRPPTPQENVDEYIRLGAGLHLELWHSQFGITMGTGSSTTLSSWTGIVNSLVLTRGGTVTYGTDQGYFGNKPVVLTHASPLSYLSWAQLALPTFSPFAIFIRSRLVALDTAHGSFWNVGKTPPGGGYPPWVEAKGYPANGFFAYVPNVATQTPYSSVVSDTATHSIWFWFDSYGAHLKVDGSAQVVGPPKTSVYPAYASPMILSVGVGNAGSTATEAAHALVYVLKGYPGDTNAAAISNLAAKEFP